MFDLLVNGAFTGQRVTGQQRYAIEVTRQLVERHSARLLRPSRIVAAHPGLAHVWAHAALPALSVRGALVSLTARSPVIARRHTVVVHDLFVLRHPEWYSVKYVRTHAPVLSAQLRTASRLAAVSAPVADELRQLLPHKRITVAPNAPSEVFRHPSATNLPPEVRETVDAPGVEGFLFAVGSRDPRKNFGRLVQAHQLLPRTLRRAFPLVIAGGDSASFAHHSVHASADVRWIGYVEDPALAALYAAATAVVVPSLDEGFGLPVVEALTAGGRLAISDIPVFRWSAGDAARYFDPEQVPDMAHTLQQVVEDPPAGVDVSAVFSRFSWPATSDVIAALATDAA